MAIYGIGAFYDGYDVSQEFIDNNLIIVQATLALIMRLFYGL
jgi:hypothetical protein